MQGNGGDKGQNKAVGRGNGVRKTRDNSRGFGHFWYLNKKGRRGSREDFFSYKTPFYKIHEESEENVSRFC